MSNKIQIKEPENKFKKFLIDFIDIIAFIVFIGGIFLFIKVFLVSIVAVKWNSMLPNYHNWDILFVDKFYWKWKNNLKRWDVLVAMPPSSDVSYLKRLIWLPWETIEIHNKWVYLCKTEDYWKTYKNNDIIKENSYKDGKLICRRLKEKYIRWKFVNLKWFNEPIITEAKCGISKFTLWSGQYLVFWDDRMYSTDSRCCFKWACIWKKDIYYITKDEILWRVLNEYFKNDK